MTSSRRAAALRHSLERALAAGGAALLGGCCGPLSAMSLAYSGIRVVKVEVAKDPALMQAKQQRYTSELPGDVCERYCAEDLEACTLAQLDVAQPKPQRELRCDYVQGEPELRSIPGSTVLAQGGECGFLCAYPGREVKRCELSPLERDLGDDVLLCRYYSPAHCVTHLPSGRPPPGLCLEQLPRIATTADYFAVAAFLEGASALAFAELALDLGRHGAPATLRARARRAARDERFHQRAFTRWGVRGAIANVSRSVACARPNLLQLALDNVAEGCVVETYSALVMAYQARHAHDHSLRTLLSRVARDELRHATLSWDIWAWAQGRLPQAARRVCEERLQVARHRLEQTLPCLPPPLQAELGLPPEHVARAMLSSLDATLWQSPLGLLRAEASAVA